MSVESTRQASGWDCASQALAELRACPGELEAFVAGLFDEFGKLVDDLLVHELAKDQAQPKTETVAMQEQIDRLAAMVADLAGSVASQTRMVGRPVRSGGREALAAAVDTTFSQGDSRPVVPGGGSKTAAPPNRRNE